VSLCIQIRLAGQLDNASNVGYDNFKPRSSLNSTSIRRLEHFAFVEFRDTSMRS